MAENEISRQEYGEMKSRFEERFSRAEARIGELEAEVRDITKSMLSIQRIELMLETLQEDQKRLMKRLEDIEREPAENWKKAVWYVIVACIGGAIALIARNIGLE